MEARCQKCGKGIQRSLRHWVYWPGRYIGYFCGACIKQLAKTRSYT